MFDGAGPDLLGVCEVENEWVLGRLAEAIDLPGRSFAVVTHESEDARGIDVSFLIDTEVLSATDTNHQVIIKRVPTRDIFYARISIADGPEFVACANHWPSRTAGQYKSEPFRMLAGETLAYLVEQLLHGEDGDKNTPILAMGDFNDEPFNRSMQEYLLGTRDPGRVRYSRSGHMLNLMWPLMQGDDPGTYLYGSDWNMLDQMLVSYGCLKSSSSIHADPESIEVFRPAVMRGRSGAPRRFGRPSRRNLNEDGYSDHYPITVRLEY
jgi:endonuclease/exonuclease/phosphatase family metal-dependent hydrolase